MPGYAAIVRLYIHQNDIRADTANALPRDHIIILPAKQAQKPAGSRHDDGLDAALRRLDLQVAHKSQSPAICYANNLLAPKFRHFYDHNPFLPIIFGSEYAPPDGIMIG